MLHPNETVVDLLSKTVHIYIYVNDLIINIDKEQTGPYIVKNEVLYEL